MDTTIFAADKKRAAVASSTTRRSAERRAVMMVRMTGGSCVSAPSTQGLGTMRRVPPPTARMAAWGGLMTALNSSMPNMPKLEMQKVPP
eukprot:scaffold11675_cov40-Attheya_sp.AAC.2